MFNHPALQLGTSINGGRPNHSGSIVPHVLGVFWLLGNGAHPSHFFSDCLLLAVKNAGGARSTNACRASAGVGALQHASAHSRTSGSPHARLESRS